VNKFQKIIRNWRGKRSQSQAAKILGTTTKSIQNWEQGVCEPESFTKKLLLDLIAHENQT
jgi:DNA-binding transcriptional regulator YiaG